VKCLRDLCPDSVLDTTDEGYNALILACKVGRLDIVRYLVKLGGVNAKDKSGCTPLHHACWEGHASIAHVLLAAGADPQVKNVNGLRPIEVCRTSACRDDYQAILRAHMMNDDSFRLPDTTPPPVSEEPLGENRETYTNAIRYLRSFPERLSAVGRGLEMPSENISSPCGVGLVDEITNALETAAPVAISPPLHQIHSDPHISSSLSPLGKQDNADLENNSVDGIYADSSEQVDRLTDSCVPPEPGEPVCADIPGDREVVSAVSGDSIIPEDDGPLPPPDLPSSSGVIDSREDDGCDESDEHACTSAREGAAAVSEESIIPECDSSLPAPDQPISGGAIDSHEDDGCPEPGKQIESMIDKQNLPHSENESTEEDLCNSLSTTADDVAAAPPPMSPITPRHGVQAVVWRVCRRSGDVTVLVDLINKHPEALHEDLRDSSGDTPLISAVRAGHCGVVEFLLQQGAYLGINDKRQNNALHVACSMDNAEIANLLAAKSKNLLNETNDSGNCPLHIAAAIGSIRVINCLLSCPSIDISRKNASGFTASEIATKGGFTAAADVLRRHETSVSVSTECDSTNISTPPHAQEDVEFTGAVTSADGLCSPSDLEIEDCSTSRGRDFVGLSVGIPVEGGADTCDTGNLSNSVSHEHTTISPSTPCSQLFRRADSIVSDQENNIDLLRYNKDKNGRIALTFADADIMSHRPRSITEVHNGIVFEEELDDDDDEDSIQDDMERCDALKSLLGYEPSPDGKCDPVRVTGFTPPPEDIDDYEKETWQYLGRALSQANRMEEETKLYSPPSTVLIPNEVVKVDIRWLYLMGSVCRVIGSRGYRSMTKRFYHWKYESVGGPAAVGPLHPFINPNAPIPPKTTPSKAPPTSQPSTPASPLVERMNPALVFALKVLDRHAKHCRKSCEIEAMYFAWERLVSSLYSPVVPQAVTYVSSPEAAAAPDNDPCIFTDTDASRGGYELKAQDSLELSPVDRSDLPEHVAILGSPGESVGQTLSQFENSSTNGHQTIIEDQSAVQTERSPPGTEVAMSLLDVIDQEELSDRDGTVNEEDESGTGEASIKFQDDVVSEALDPQQCVTDEVMEDGAEESGGYGDTGIEFEDQLEYEFGHSESESEGEAAEDLMLLGPLPSELNLLLRINEHVLWDIFTYYVQNKLSIPSQNMSDKKRVSKRILSLGGVWNLLTDFAVCPILCSKSCLKSIVDSLMAPGQLPTIFYSPDIPAPKLKSTEPVISFNGFYKILWAIARDCLDAPSATDPTSRLLSLLMRMDGSSGRRKMASHSRDARLIASFNLNDQSVQRQIANAERARQVNKEAKAAAKLKMSVSPTRSSRLSNSQKKSQQSPGVTPYGGMGALSGGSEESPSRQSRGGTQATQNSKNISSVGVPKEKTLSKSTPGIASRTNVELQHVVQDSSDIGGKQALKPSTDAIAEPSATTSSPSGLPPISPHSSLSKQRNLSLTACEEAKGSISSIENTTECNDSGDEKQQVLEGLAKAPVADRVNAKLAAKQFEALVNKIKTDSPTHRTPRSQSSSRSTSPQRERSASIPLPLQKPELIIPTSDDGDSGPGSGSKSLGSRGRPINRRNTPPYRVFAEAVRRNSDGQPGSPVSKHERSPLPGRRDSKTTEGTITPEAVEEEAARRQSALEIWRKASPALPNSESLTSENSSLEPIYGDEEDATSERSGSLVLKTELDKFNSDETDLYYSPNSKTRKRRGTITRRR